MDFEKLYNNTVVGSSAGSNLVQGVVSGAFVKDMAVSIFSQLSDHRWSAPLEWAQDREGLHVSVSREPENCRLVNMNSTNIITITN